MDINLALMTGVDIPIPEIQIAIHQPTLKEISYIGEQTFFMGMQTLLIDKKNLMVQGNFVLENTSNFQVFMTVMQEKEMADKKEAVISVLQLLFLDAQTIFTPNSILLNRQGQQSIIDENNFDILQNYMKEIFCVKIGPMDQQSFNPQSAKAKEIAEKLMRGRQRVAEQKGEQSGSAFGRYISILAIGTNTIRVLDAINLTMYQLYDLVERYTLYLNWDLDIRSRLAGATPDSKPEDWMKNIH